MANNSKLVEKLKSTTKNYWKEQEELKAKEKEEELKKVLEEVHYILVEVEPLALTAAKLGNTSCEVMRLILGKHIRCWSTEQSNLIGAAAAVFKCLEKDGLSPRIIEDDGL